MIPKQIVSAESIMTPSPWFENQDPPTPEGLASFKFEDEPNMQDKTYTHNIDSTRSIRLTISEGGRFASFESDVPITMVYVKGGNVDTEEGKQMGTIFTFTPPALQGSLLYANDRNGSQQISHVTFYYDPTPPIPDPKGSITIIKKIATLEGTGARYLEGNESFTFNLYEAGKQGIYRTIVINPSTDDSPVSKATFSDLPLGQYTIEEVYDSEKYQSNVSVIGEVTISNNETNLHQTFTVVNTEKEIITPDPKGSITIIKEIDPLEGTKRPLALGESFTFNLFKVEETPRLLGEEQPFRTITISGIDGVQPSQGAFTDLPLGKYSIEEIYDSEKYESNVLLIGEVIISNTETKLHQSFTVINTEKEITPEPKGSIKVIKSVGNEDGFKLPLITFKLFNVDGEVETLVKDRIKITDINGEALFECLAPGKYKLVEIIPFGFTTSLNSENNIIEIKADSEATLHQTVKVVNTPVGLGSIKVVKTIDKVGGEPHAGVRFKLYYVVGCYEFLVRAQYTGDNGEVNFTNLIPGKYRLEEAVPEGYTTSLNSDNNIIEICTTPATPLHKTVNVVNTLIRGSIKVVKSIDTIGGTPQKDVTFKLYKVDENVETLVGEPQVTDSKGELTFANLVPGKYRLEEVVPEGYTTSLNAQNSIITITLNSESTLHQTVKVVNTAKTVIDDEDDSIDEDLPFTGGSFEFEWLYALLGIILLGLGVRVKYLRR